MKNRHRVSQVVGKLILVTAAGARARPASGRQAANQGRGKADRGQLRQAAGVAAPPNPFRVAVATAVSE